jgi:HSP20 family molecular chaperone IbpA
MSMLFDSIYPVSIPRTFRSTEGNVLSISGERKTEEKGQDYQETSYGKFDRAVTLPQGVETDKISARCEHGVLEIRVPSTGAARWKEDPNSDRGKR